LSLQSNTRTGKRKRGFHYKQFIIIVHNLILLLGPALPTAGNKFTKCGEDSPKLSQNCIQVLKYLMIKKDFPEEWPSGMLRRVALIRTDVSVEFSASIFRVTRIGELRTTLAVTLYFFEACVGC
jgi:hypothetical protein